MKVKEWKKVINDSAKDGRKKEVHTTTTKNSQKEPPVTVIINDFPTEEYLVSNQVHLSQKQLQELL